MDVGWQKCVCVCWITERNEEKNERIDLGSETGMEEEMGGGFGKKVQLNQTDSRIKIILRNMNRGCLDSSSDVQGLGVSLDQLSDGSTEVRTVVRVLQLHSCC